MTYLKNLSITISIILILLIYYSCNTTDPGNGSEINLTAEDVSCTESWLKITGAAGVNLILKRDNEEVMRINVVSSDTTVMDDSLLPNKAYTYQLFANQGRTALAKANITTMDTTSHNFTWQSWTFGGEAGSSVLYDVAIINENDIWAVGEVYLKDSLGNPDPVAYNAVHWDGIKWKLKKIQYFGDCSAVQYPPLRTIWCSSENGIILSNGGSIGWWNGSLLKLECGINSLLTGSINKIWGISKDDFYVVGNNGNIAHYQNGNWQNIESGTELHFYDIWGQPFGNNHSEILCIASNLFTNKGSKVYKINNNNIVEIKNTGLPWSINTLWFVPERKYLIGGDGLYTINKLGEDWNRDYSIAKYYKTGIRGNNLNDIVVVGAYGLLVHFNGLTWKSYQHETYINGSYGSVDIKGNIICCTGGVDNRAIITIGRR